MDTNVSFWSGLTTIVDYKYTYVNYKITVAFSFYTFP